MVPLPHNEERSSIWSVACIVAVVVACLDVSFSILDHARELYHPLRIAAPMAVTAALTFLVFVVAWFALVRPFVRSRGAASAALGALIVVAFVLGAAFEVRLSPTNLIRYLLLAVVVCLSAAGTYPVARSSRGAAIGTALPWIALFTLVFVWIAVLRVRAPTSPASLGAAAVWGVASLLVLALSWRPSLRPAMRRAAVILWAIVVVAPALTLLERGGESSAVESRDNAVSHVFLIMIDTLRRDALSCYGEGGAATPHIDALAADGVTFDDAVSASSWTLPAVCSIMSGLAPDVHGTTQYKQALHDSVRTLSDSMRSAGYRTAAIGSNPMLSPAYNVGQGFDRYDWYPRTSDDSSLGKWVLRRLRPKVYRRDLSTTELCDAAADWSRRHRDEDTFLWLHIFDPHHPYTPPARFRPEGDAPASMPAGFENRVGIQAGTLAPTAAERAWIRRLYLGEVRYVDEQVGRFTAALKELGIYDDALIVLTSDHGEEFWEHGGFEHGHTLYRELLNVPLIVKAPRAPGGKRVEALVATQSVAPTVLDLCGVARDSTYTAASLAPVVLGEGAGGGEPVFGGGLRYYEDRECVTTPHLKYIRSKVTGRDEAYDRIADPLETRPLDASSKLYGEARDLIDNYLLWAEEAQVRLGIEGGWQANLDRQTIERLKALGYL